MSDVTLAAEADAAMKVAYPAIVVAWKSVGSRLPAAEEDEGRAKDWHDVGDLLAYMDGHGTHGGWSFDPSSQVMTCACGSPMYEVGDPVKAVA
jgi:hypothetical protein